jgi:hypothetical protein
MTLANILRVDAVHHRSLPDDSELVQAIAVLARAQQDAVWNRQQLANQLRSLLREYFPAALKAFQAKGIGLTSREARAVLAAALTPTAAAKLTKTRLKAALRRSGRQRNLDAWTDRLHALFQEQSLRQLPMVEAAFGTQTQALLLQLDAACQAADDLAEATTHAFHQHPDAAIITSFPGLADLRTGPGRDRRRPQSVRQRPRPQGLRRSSTNHPRVRQVRRGPSPQGQEPAAGRRRLRVGIRVP